MMVFHVSYIYPILIFKKIEYKNKGIKLIYIYLRSPISVYIIIFFNGKKKKK